MTKNHLKARAAPRTWNIARKTNTFVTRPNPGSQKLDMTLPLDLVLKTLGIGPSRKDINYLIKNTEVEVNGLRRHDRRFGVGFQDVIAVPQAKIFAILSMDSHGRLTPQRIEESEAGTKLAQVKNTTAVKGGKLALHLTDGRNITVTKSFARGSTVRVDLAKNSIKQVYAVEPKSQVILTRGKHRGKRGTIESINEEFVTVETPDGSISTKKEYAFVLGGVQ